LPPIRRQPLHRVEAAQGISRLALWTRGT